MARRSLTPRSPQVDIGHGEPGVNRTERTLISVLRSVTGARVILALVTETSRAIESVARTWRDYGLPTFSGWSFPAIA